MGIKVFSLSLSTWYQSQGRKLYFFWFTRVINSGNRSSDRVSFRSPFPSPKAFRSAISWSENPHHHQHFSSDIFRRLFRWLFPTPTTSSGVHRGDLQLFSKHRSQKPIHAPPTCCFSPVAWIPRAGVWGCVAHFLVPSFYQQARLVPSCTSKPLSVLSEPCFSIFFGISASAGLLSASDGSSLPWPRLVCALGRPLLHPQSLFSFVWVSTYQVLLPQLWSDLPLGLSSIQT